MEIGQLAARFRNGWPLADRLVNLLQLGQLALLDPRLQSLQVFSQALRAGFPNGPVLGFAILAQTEKVDLVRLPSALDAHLRFLLMGVTRGGLADDLFPAVFLLELPPPRIPFRLPTGH